MSVQTVLYAADSRRFIVHFFILHLLLLDLTHHIMSYDKLPKASCWLSAVLIMRVLIYIHCFWTYHARLLILMCFFNLRHHLRHVIPTTALHLVSVHHVRGLFCVLSAKCFTITTSLLLGLYVCFLKPSVWPFVESSRRLLLLIPRLIRALLFSFFSFFWACTFYLFILLYLMNRQQRLATFP